MTPLTPTQLQALAGGYGRPGGFDTNEEDAVWWHRGQDTGGYWEVVDTLKDLATTLLTTQARVVELEAAMRKAADRLTADDAYASAGHRIRIQVANSLVQKIQEGFK